MWSLLRRNQEPLLAGTAVALVIIAGLTHGNPMVQGTEGAPPVSPAEVASCAATTLLNVPRDHDYYRAKWRRIATDFYAAHPVAEAEIASQRSGPAIVTASLSDHSAPPNDPALMTANATRAMVKPVSHVAHSPSTPDTSVAPAKIVNQTASRPLITARNRLPGNLIVASAVIGGLLAFFSFRLLWPETESSNNRAIRTLVQPPIIGQQGGGSPRREPSVTLRIELPAHWVYLRPGLRQRLKPMALSICYLASGMAAWTIYF